MALEKKIYQLSLKELCEKLTTGDLSSLDVVNCYIAHIERENPKVNSIVSLKASRARQLARKADEYFNKFKKPLGPLHGVPFTIKDAFRAKDFKTSYGVPPLHYLRARSSCDVVERLEKSGAILLGQTNVPFSCFEWQTRSPIYGLTKNPYDMERTCGGSSGGSAASLAMRMSPFEIGSDIAGSIRYPAHCCGVYGLRPSHGRVRSDDMGPFLRSSSFKNFISVGPLARSIEDLELVLNVIADFEKFNGSKKEFKIGYTLEWSGIGVEPESAKLIKKELNNLKEKGHEVQEVEINIDMKRAYWIWGVILGFEYRLILPLLLRFGFGLSFFNWWFNKVRFHSDPVTKVFEIGLYASKLDYEKALAEASELRREFDQFMKKYDVWLTPVSSGPAIKHQKPGKSLELSGRNISYSDYLGNFLCPTTLFHHPSLTVPIGRTHAGLPIGVQYHGHRSKDEELLSVVKSL